MFGSKVYGTEMARATIASMRVIWVNPNQARAAVSVIVIFHPVSGTIHVGER